MLPPQRRPQRSFTSASIPTRHGSSTLTSWRQFAGRFSAWSHCHGGATAAQAVPPGKIVESGHRRFVLPDGLLYHQGRRGNRLCVGGRAPPLGAQADRAARDAPQRALQHTGSGPQVCGGWVRAAVDEFLKTCTM
jgi:hypothetical protein